MAILSDFCKNKHAMKNCPYFKIAKAVICVSTFIEIRRAFLSGHKIDVKTHNNNGKIDVEFIIKP
jgi:hypothetical protein